MREATLKDKSKERQKLEAFFRDNELIFEYDADKEKYTVYVSKFVRSET